MAKDYRKGDCYKLFYNAGAFDQEDGTADWQEVIQVDDLGVDFQTTDVEVNERGMNKGHMSGQSDPMFTFTLMDDAGGDGTDPVSMIIAAITSTLAGCADVVVYLAVAQDMIGANNTAIDGTKYWHMECVCTGSLSANQGDVATYDVEARRYANSANNLTESSWASTP